MKKLLALVLAALMLLTGAAFAEIDPTIPTLSLIHIQMCIRDRNNRTDEYSRSNADQELKQFQVNRCSERHELRDGRSSLKDQFDQFRNHQCLHPDKSEIALQAFFLWALLLILHSSRSNNPFGSFLSLQQSTVYCLLIFCESIISLSAHFVN